MCMKKRRKRYKLRKKYKILLIILVCLCLLTKITNKHSKYIEKEEKTKENIVEKKIVEDEPKEEIIEPIEEIEEQEENIQENASYEKSTSIDASYTTRMTSFWANDGYGTGECTGSGLCSWDFGINENGWYVWQGKLVVAAATTYLANQGWQVGSGVHLYKYWEELILTIDDVQYEAVILDSCGSSMRTDRIDLFVSNDASARDTNIQVRRK